MANSDFLDRQLRREDKDEYHFWMLTRKFENYYKDPNDVLIDAERRLEELTAEERDALAEARGLRDRRSRAEKKLSKLVS